MTKIEKVNADIARTKVHIAAQKAKLRELERRKVNLENEQIVALFRREKLNESEFATLMQTQRGGNHEA